MSVEGALSDITTRLRQGRFANEQAISQGVVLRLLQELGWDTWDTAVVWPEYQTGEGRADFALCHPPSKPVAFIEVKQPGKAEDGIRQALEYAFHTGVPFIVLTDGKSWSFYLPAEQGSYEDRRVYKLDLLERQQLEAVEALNRYLLRSRIESGEAIESARREYRNRSRRVTARQAIGDAWRELVEKGDETLVALLANAVETKAGIRPEDDDVAEFLTKLGRSRTANETVTPSRPRTYTPTLIAPSPLASNAVLADPPTASRRGTLTLFGRSLAYNNAKEAMVYILKELARRDPTFLDRCGQHPDNQGKKRKYIAKDSAELYPDRPDLRECSEPIGDGWLVSTNLSNISKRSIVKLAADVAGLEVGKDVTVEF